MTERLNKLLIKFFEDHGDDLNKSDVIKFQKVWDKIHNSVDDDVWKKGSDHYMHFTIHPSQFINENKLLFAEGNIIMYICRHRLKGKAKDIEKAIHYCEMILERDY